jgi:triacylglycerol lipase
MAGAWRPKIERAIFAYMASLQGEARRPTTTGHKAMGRKLEASLAILNGAIGDYLARSANGLATELCFVAGLGGQSPLVLNRPSLARAFPMASTRIALLVHGLMSTESVWEMKDGSDYGTRLASDLGYTPIYVRYNSGRAIADNGASLALALETLVEAYPGRLEEIVPIGHSMGGLVVRSACHAARLEKQRWLSKLRRAIYVGTPHLGAPMERVGRTVARLLGAINDPFTRLVAEIADLRSDGLKDLGDADLRHVDRVRRAGLGLRDPQHPVPLLPEIQHYLVAGSLSDDPWLAALFGDAVVPVRSATAGHPSAALLAGAIPPSHVRLMPGLSHVMLAHDPAVYAFVRDACATGTAEEHPTRRERGERELG